MALTIRATEQLLRSGSANPMFNVPGLSYLGIRRRWTPMYGHSWQLLYESAASNDINIPSPAETAYGLVPVYFFAELEAMGPKHRLTVSTPDDPTGGAGGIIAATYDLVGDTITRDIREHPRSLALGQAVIRDIDRKLSDQDADVTIQAGDATTLYNLLAQRNGSMGFEVSVFVLTVSFIAGSRAQITVAYANKGKVYTTAQMIAETGPPTGILASINEAVTTSTPTAVSGYTYGWLKKTPTVTTEAGNRVRVTLQYTLEQWSTDYVYSTV